MRIGELARRVGVSTDTVRFYERSGWLPRASRRANAYRDYRESDAEHLRLLIDLRRLDIPLQELDARLAELERHLALTRPSRPILAVLDATPCCDAAAAVVGSAEGACTCCAPAGN